MNVFRPLGTLLAATTFMVVLCHAHPKTALGRETAGWIEYAFIRPGDIQLMAKLDTGAQTSSLHANEILRFQKSGKDWVRFRVTDRNNEVFIIERPVVRTATIKRHYGERQRRPVVLLGICVGSIFKETEVNLVDRTGFDYPLLLGRSFMAGSLLIDPGSQHTLEPACRVQNLR